MKALILAAGYATRLYPLTKEYPKPLLMVGRKPIINHALEKLERLSDIDEIFVVTNSKFFPKFKNWAARLKINKRITLVDDLTRTISSRRGAIGDMHFVIKNKDIRDDLLVVGGDNIFDAGLKRFLAFAKSKKKYPVIGTYRIKSIDQAHKYGVIKLDRKRQVIDFKEKPKQPDSKLVAMCIYYFPKETLGLIREYLRAKSGKRDATGFYIDWLRQKTAVYGFVFSGSWYDIGDHKFLNQAKEKFN